MKEGIAKSRPYEQKSDTKAAAADKMAKSIKVQIDDRNLQT